MLAQGERALSKMEDVVDINDWVEQKVNVLVQRFRCCRDTAPGQKGWRAMFWV